MKKVLISVLLVFIAASAQSQILISLILGDKLNSDKLEFGLDGGLTYSTIQGLNAGDYRPGFNLGFYFDIKIKDSPWKLNTGVMVKSPGGIKNLPVYSLNNDLLDSIYSGGEVKRTLRYYNVPILIKYNFASSIYLKAGAMLGLRGKCDDLFTNSYSGEDIELKKDIKKKYTLIDAGVTAGIGYRFMGGNGMNLGIQYYQGLVAVNKDSSVPDQRNSAFYVNIGIPIGKGKAAVKANVNE